MRKFILICTLCTILLVGCMEKESEHTTPVTKSAVSIETNDEQGTKAESKEEAASKKISRDPAEIRKLKYDTAKELIKKQQYNEAYDILISLSAHVNKFPDLFSLIKNVRLSELKKQKKWTDDEGKDRIIVSGNTVKVKLHYTSKNWKDKVANYTGKISRKRCTTNKIAVVHNGKVDYILSASNSGDSLFYGELSYEVYDAREGEDVNLFSKQGLADYKESEKQYEESLEKKKQEGKSSQKSIEKPTPQIGMTASEVEASSWGKPVRKNITEYPWGKREQWVYSIYRYIYFENGRVTSIQWTE
ncbi:MAG: hypothetical protein HFG37_11735 [Eubacterium sp.]|nr:hypothetical protein [Eubacterium sp.]